MIMGYTCSGETMQNGSVSCPENITRVTISNAYYDDLYATGIDESVKPTDQVMAPDEWDEETYFHAKFNGDIFAGNTSFSASNTTNILVKRRKKGEFVWFTLFDIPAESAEDYMFTVIDPYAPIGTLEYAVVPIIGGFEGEYSIAEIDYSFKGLMLIEPEQIVWTIADIVITENKNRQLGIVNTIEGNYPYVFINSENNYFTGTVSATYIRMINGCVDDSDLHGHYQEVMEFLNDGVAKVLKYSDGRIRMIMVTTPPSDESSEHYNKHTISFDYTEIGNTLSNDDMNKYGFLDVGEEWWVR